MPKLEKNAISVSTHLLMKKNQDPNTKSQDRIQVDRRSLNQDETDLILQKAKNL